MEKSKISNDPEGDEWGDIIGSDIDD